MVLTSSEVCDFGKPAPYFSLKSTENIFVNFKEIKGDKGTMVMFICNHCPYVKAVIDEVVEVTNEIKNYNFNSIAIMSNDYDSYPEDNFENMKIFSQKFKFKFPYVIDIEQKVAKNYGALCTPDFFCFNNNDELQYRGRIRELNNLSPVTNSKPELLNAVKQIIKTGKYSDIQYPSVGCSIKWR